MKKFNSLPPKLDYENFPYGKITKNLKNCVAWLNRNRRRLNKWFSLGEFDYPDYWEGFGLSKKITYKLSSDEVDWLQSELSNWENYMV